MSDNNGNAGFAIVGQKKGSLGITKSKMPGKVA